LIDFIESDVFGFDHFRYFKKEGTEFPMPFKMKHMSTLAYTARHPMMTGFLGILLGVNLYGQMTLGKALFNFFYMVAIMIGIHFEEKELKRHAGKEFIGLCSVIPNLVIPDFSIFFYGQKEMNELKKRFENATKIT
jgi:protein-S-isoprenylcysteine O-methyltransferase Ste14